MKLFKGFNKTAAPLVCHPTVASTQWPVWHSGALQLLDPPPVDSMSSAPLTGQYTVASVAFRSTVIAGAPTSRLHVISAAEGGAARDEVHQRGGHASALLRPPLPPGLQPCPVVQAPVLERPTLLACSTDATLEAVQSRPSKACVMRCRLEEMSETDNSSGAQERGCQTCSFCQVHAVVEHLSWAGSV